MTTTSRMAAALADHPFMSAIPIESLRRLTTNAQVETYPAGTTIFAEGRPADRFYLIRHGLVRLEMETAGRGLVEVETLGPDSALGWSWLFAPYRWQLSATAVERTTAVVCDAAALRAIMAADPAVGYELMRRFAGVMLDRLQATRRRLTGDVGIPQAATCGPWAGEPSGNFR